MYICVYGFFVSGARDSPESLRAVPQISQIGSKFEREILVVSRYVVATHGGNALLFWRILTFGVAAHRLGRAAGCRRRVASHRVVVVRRRRAPTTVLATRRLYVEHRGVRLDVRIDLEERCKQRRIVSECVLPNRSRLRDVSEACSGINSDQSHYFFFFTCLICMHRDEDAVVID